MGDRDCERDAYDASLVDWMLAVAPTRTLSDRFAEEALRERLLGLRDELKLGRYQLRNQVASGARGVVYRARDPQSGRDVAVKLLHRRGGPGDPISSLRVAREARALARLTHPNVVPVYDIGTFDHDEYDSGLFVVMELVEGRSLAQLLAGRRVSLRWVVDLMLQAARGLAAAHRAGIVHRHFKLDSVVVGADGRARVFDFGIERGSEPGHHASPSTLAAVHASPHRREGRVDARSDQFSFCIALCEAVCGGRPGKGVELPRHSRRRNVPPWLAAVLRRGLQADPSRRFADMDELISALHSGRRRNRRRGVLAG